MYDTYEERDGTQASWRKRRNHIPGLGDETLKHVREFATGPRPIGTKAAHTRLSQIGRYGMSDSK